jgi:ribosome-associated translation inhibitor RaiA
MKVDIRAKNIDLSPTLREYIQRRIGFALGARETQIQKIQVMLSDINGPKGGSDKRCRILLRLSGLKDIVIEDVQSELRVAIDRAASRASHTVSRRLTKWHGKQHTPISRLTTVSA